MPLPLYVYGINNHTTLLNSTPLLLHDNLRKLFLDDEASLIIENNHQNNSRHSTRYRLRQDTKEPLAAEAQLTQRHPIPNRLSEVHVVDEQTFVQCDDVLFRQTIFAVCGPVVEKDNGKRNYIPPNVECCAKISSLQAKAQDPDLSIITSRSSLVKVLCTHYSLRRLAVSFNIEIDSNEYDAPYKFWGQIQPLGGLRVTEYVSLIVNFVERGRLVRNMPRNSKEKRIVDWLEQLQSSIGMWLQDPLLALLGDRKRQSEDRGPSRLLGLPQELRDQIYRYILKSDEPVLYSISHGAADKHRKAWNKGEPCRAIEDLLDTQILRVNKQLFVETLNIIQQKSILHHRR